MIKSDILFNGYYGQLNTGDDAFVEVSSWAAKRIWQKENVRFLAIGNKLPKTVVPSKGYPIPLPRSYSFQKRILLNNTKFFISAGGSTFHSEINSKNLKSIALEQKKKNGLKLGAIGVSLGPFKSVRDEKSVVHYLRNMDFLALRDKRSFKYANSLDLPYKPIDAFDLAALLPDIYGCNVDDKEIEHKRKIIGISLCNYESYIKAGNVENEQRRNNFLKDVISKIDELENIEFHFFIINGNSRVGDSNITLETIKECNLKSEYKIFDYNKCTKQVWMEIATCDLVISTRLHAGIFACFSNTPFIMVEYHQKCTDFLSDVGYNEDLRIFDGEVTVSECMSHVRRILFDKNYIIPKYMQEMKEKALLNFNNINL